MLATSNLQLATLWQRGREFLGCEHAIMGGAMSWVSERNLVSALSNSGAFGVIAASSMTPELLATEIEATKKLLHTSPNGTGRNGEAISGEGKKVKTPPPSTYMSSLIPEGEGMLPPFGVNLILMHPKLDELVQVCVDARVSHVVLAGGIPKSATVDALKAGGIKVIGFAPTVMIGRKLIKMGIDALIIEGNEAGGHIGPVSTSVLAQEILPEITEVPVFVAGGIGRGEAIASFLEMGASGVQLGTRFVCAHESIAHEKFKQCFINASARDAGVSVQYHPDFPVIPVRAIQNKASAAFMAFQKDTVEKVFAGELNKQQAQLAIEHFWAGALRKAVIEGDVEHGSVMAGQSVGMVHRTQSTQEIIDELVQQAAHYLDKRMIG